jgi:2',3'-cyclic-nucleotide 3'-phosphodiesterase
LTPRTYALHFRKGTSLWLVPSPSSFAATALQNLIASLSKTHSSPSFPPHITLANLPACISIPEIISSLSSEEKIKVAFEEVRTGKTFFQSVFAAIQASSRLSQLHEHVHKTLGVQAKTPEFAHLSLYYGDEGKEEMATQLQEDGVVELDAGRCIVAGVHNFMVEDIWVVQCQGRPEEWSVVEKVRLRDQDRAL